MKKTLLILSVLLLTISACKKNNYKKFEGTYEVKSSGTINYFIGDTTFVDEPGKVIIKKGEGTDELFMYVETNYVTSIAPLGVYAEAKIEGDNYVMEERNMAITITLGDLALPLNFKVSATGTLTDGKTLTSEVVFTGGITGTLTSVGTK